MVINQFHSIGDILFIEPICRHFWINNGTKPILPVRDHLLWLSNYIESASFVPMSKFTLDYDSLIMTNPDYLPLRFANQILNGLSMDDHSDFENCMPDKYKLAGLPPDNWQSINLKFNICKGLTLFKKLGLTPKEYILINENSQPGRVKISVKTSKKVVYMEETPGFTVLDWFYVMIHAAENHHVSTSTFYIMQAITNQFQFDSKIFIYPRPNNDGIRGISQLKHSFKCELVS